MEPVLRYTQSEEGWRWEGSLIGQPAEADSAARFMQGIWGKYRLPEQFAKNVVSLALFPDSLMEVAIRGLKAAGGEKNIGGVTIRLVPAAGLRIAGADTRETGKPAAAAKTLSYHPVMEHGGWESPDLPDGELLHRAFMKVLHSTAPAKGDANRAMRLANVAFEKDGPDLLLVSTDGHRLTLCRLPGFMRSVPRMPESGAIVPSRELRELLPRLRGARETVINLTGHAGEKTTYSYGFEGSYGPRIVDAWQGALVLDGKPHPLPVVLNEFVKWRHVFPVSDWQVTVDSLQMHEAVSGLLQKWTAAMRIRPKRAARREPSGRLEFAKQKLTLDITPDSPGAGSFTAGLHTAGLSQNRAVRFYINFRYLREALKVIEGPVVITGENDGTRSVDGASYLVKPVSFLEPSGPAEILIMPMYPPR